MSTECRADPLHVWFDPQPLLNYAGRVVRQARLQHGWTQEELGRRVGLKKSSIAAFEAGVGVANFRRILHLLVVLGVSFQDLLPPQAPQLPTEIVELVNILQCREPVLTERVLALVKVPPERVRRRVR
jgi:transcriptional regulator with XRE-family HTH domain